MFVRYGWQKLQINGIPNLNHCYVSAVEQMLLMCPGTHITRILSPSQSLVVLWWNVRLTSCAEESHYETEG